MKQNELPSYIKDTDRYLSFTQSAGFAVFYYVMLITLFGMTLFVSLWAILGIILTFGNNGANHQLGSLFDHITCRKTLDRERLIKYVNARPNAYHFGFFALVTGWSLHLSYTTPLMLVVAITGVWSILSLSALKTFIDKSVVSDNET